MSVIFGEAPRHPQSITLLIKGTNYEIQSPPGDVGLKWARSVHLAADLAGGRNVTKDDRRVQLLLDDASEREMVEELLGDTLPAMLADGVPWSTVQHAAQTVLAWVSIDVETARRFWVMAAPKAVKPKRSPAKKQTR